MMAGGPKAIDSVLTLPLVSFGFFLKLLPVSEAWCHSNQIQTNHKRDHNSNNALCHHMCQSMPKTLFGSISSNFQSNVRKGYCCYSQMWKLRLKRTEQFICVVCAVCLGKGFKSPICLSNL